MYSIDVIFQILFCMEICNYICHIDAQFLHVSLGAGEDSACPKTPWHTHDKPQQC